MKHHVIVKYNDTVTDRKAMNDRVEELFRGLIGTCDGVHDVICHRNCIARDNRWDLMIVIDIEKEKLDEYASSAIHLEWKRDWAKYLEKKCIFDYED